MGTFHHCTAAFLPFTVLDGWCEVFENSEWVLCVAFLLSFVYILSILGKLVRGRVKFWKQLLRHPLASCRSDFGKKCVRCSINPQCRVRHSKRSATKSLWAISAKTAVLGGGNFDFRYKSPVPGNSGQEYRPGYRFPREIGTGEPFDTLATVCTRAADAKNPQAQGSGI